MEQYPNDWSSRRQRVLDRDGYTCQNCGARGSPYGNAELHVHHSVPVSKGGSHNISNLITHCKSCHDAIHGSQMAPTASTTRRRQASEPEIEWDWGRESKWFLRTVAWLFILGMLINIAGGAGFVLFFVIYIGLKYLEWKLEKEDETDSVNVSVK